MCTYYHTDITAISQSCIIIYSIVRELAQKILGVELIKSKVSDDLHVNGRVSNLLTNLNDIVCFAIISKETCNE